MIARITDTSCSLYCVSFPKMVGHNINKQHVLVSNGLHVFSYAWLILYTTSLFDIAIQHRIQYISLRHAKTLTRVYEPEKQTVLSVWRFLRKTGSLHEDELHLFKSRIGKFWIFTGLTFKKEVYTLATDACLRSSYYKVYILKRTRKNYFSTVK